MSAVSMLTKGEADVVASLQALQMNINAAKGLQGVLRTGLGPRGTMKMLISGAGDIKLTKDGQILLNEMQIQHPTAALVARSAIAQDDVTGDGTTSAVLLTGELMRQAERLLQEGLHPHVIVEGWNLAKERTKSFLESFKIKKDVSDRELLSCIARTSLRTKVAKKLADHLAEIVTEAVLTIQRPSQPLDLFMIEILAMQHHSDTDTRLVKGLVLDHGARHPHMPKSLNNCFVLTCNVSLEMEKAVDNITFRYKNAEQREEMVGEERKFVDERVCRIIELKREVCNTTDKNFVIVNQKGIDPGSLQMLANEGIIALRRAKRRNMERLTLACGGTAVNSVNDLTPDILGKAEKVYQHSLGEEKYTFIEGVVNPFSCTILMKGPNKHTILQIKDAIRDGVRSVKNTLEDGCLVPGAAAFEIAAYLDLMKYIDEVKGRLKFGIQSYADALMVIPKTLAENSGFDVIDTILGLQEAAKSGLTIGLDVQTGDPIDPEIEGIYDNYNVKHQILENSTGIASQLLLVDEVLRAKKSSPQKEQ